MRRGARRVGWGVGLLALAAVVMALIPWPSSQPSVTDAADATTATVPAATAELTSYARIGYDRSYKLDLMEELPEPPRLVVLGGSRTQRFEPNFIEQLTGLPAMNSALTNFRPEDAWAIVSFLLERSPDSRLDVFWGITANALTDKTFAPGLVYDERLSAAFPDALVTSQKEELGKVAVRDLIARNHFSARGFLRWNIYDKQRDAGRTLDASLDRWMERYVETEQPVATAKTDRARGYLEKTLGLLNEHDVKPCLVLMPYHPRALTALQGTDWRERQEEAKAYLENLHASYGFTVLDYTDISSFDGHPDWFYDGAHITVENARLLLRQAVQAAPDSFR